MHAKDPGKPSEPQRRRDLPRKADPAADGLGLSLGGVSAQTVLALQRGIGNAAVSRVIERSRHQHGAGCGHPQAVVGAGAPVQRSPVQRRTGDAPAARPGEPVVQRAITYAKADWSRQHLSPDRFAELLQQASGEQEGDGFSVPYRELFKALEESAITIEIDEQTDIRGARALFALSNEGEGGALRITPPKDQASPLELREFAATVTHEMQHALDSVTGRFKSQEKPQTMAQRKISTELRAFGEEAAAALKLAMGDSYSKSQGKLSAILKTIPGDRLTPERSRLAGEFHTMDSYRAAGRDPLDAFGAAIPIPNSVLLERVAGYLSFYKLVADTPTSAEALQWLRATPAVVEKGLVEGTVLFHNHRPQPE
ncbi:hypothetical protein ACFWNL_01900 [Kitasatospora sp. NPDC058397]|uniref:hypothetical protein n=1 Tax=unclassified Kitasatospora TaxID=2633591 RepID=UPI00364AE36D